MNVPLKPTDYVDLEGQPVVFATRPAAGASHKWMPNVAYMVAGAAIFFLGAACAFLATPPPHIAARGASAGALASTRAVRFPWSGKSGLLMWDSWSLPEKCSWCDRHEDDRLTTRMEREEYNAHCSMCSA